MQQPKYYLVLDLETLGLNMALHQIAEFGGVVLNAETLLEVGAYRSYITPRPPVYFENDALKVNGLSIDTLYREGRPGFEVWSTINAWLQGISHNPFDIHTVCTNKSFDMPRIEREMTLYGFGNLHVHFANKWDLRDMSWSFDLPLERIKLQTLCEYFNVPYVNAHSALNDARLTAEVFRRIITIRKALSGVLHEGALSQLLSESRK